MASKTGKNIKHYILLKDIVGFEKIKIGLLRIEALEPYQALKGEIFYKEEKKNEFDEDTFVSAENQDRHVNCTEEKFKPLSSRLFKILIAIPSKIERMYLLNSEEMVKNIMNIEKGDMVDVEVCHSNILPKTVSGRIAFVGNVQGKIGDYFGIRFKEAYTDSDGTLNRMVYFHAKPNHGLFVSADKIKSVTKKKDIPKEHLPAYSESRAKSRKGRKAVESVGDEYGGHQVNTRVVFFADGGKEIHGVLKFLGRLSIIDDTVWAIVETDKNFLNDKAGSAYKHFKEFKALKIRTNHALVVLPDELMKEDNFYGQIQVKKEGTTEVEQCKPQKEFEENILRADLHKHSVNAPSQVDNVQSQQLEEAEPKIELGMMVEVMIKEKLYYGCVKWLGTLDLKGKMIELLGLEMETYEIANNSGFFLGQKYFDCPEGKGFFAKTKICRVDRRSGDATSKQDNFNVDRVTSSNKNINPSPSRGIPAIYLENTTELEVRQPALPDLASLPDLPQVTMKKPQPKPRTMIKADAKIEEPVKPSSVSHKDDIVGEQTEMKNEVFKNVEDQCSCAICLEFADEAVECSNCHQVFCQKCIVGLEGCPSCRQTPFRTQPNVILRRIFGSMTTNCTNEGCKERPTRSNLTSHLEKCEWSTIECPNDGCDQKYRKFGSEQHKRQCVYRSEACIGCGHQYKMLDLANHQDQCLFVDVPCMNSNCNEHFLRKDESSHISVCKQQIIRCSFCFFSGTRIQVLHHTIDIHYQEAVGPMSSLAPRSFGASNHQL